MSTGKSFSEAIILASTNPQYDKRIRVSDKHLPVYEIFFLCPVTPVANLKSSNFEVSDDSCSEFKILQNSDIHIRNLKCGVDYTFYFYVHKEILTLYQVT